MYAESDLLPLSALQHLLFCERQCALIHLEQVWTENVFTAEGRLMHERVHGGGGETRKGVRTAFGLAVRSLRLGLSGQADVVEIGRGIVRPVEHKRGRPKRDNCDAVQLCAQALCLEEMLGVSIPAGDLFYGKTRRRKEIRFDAELRTETEASARRLHELMIAGRTPPPVPASYCVAPRAGAWIETFPIACPAPSDAANRSADTWPPSIFRFSTISSPPTRRRSASPAGTVVPRWTRSIACFPSSIRCWFTTFAPRWNRWGWTRRWGISMFECVVDPAQWVMFRAQLIEEIEEDRDSLRFYFLGANWRGRVEHVGAKPSLDFEAPLIA